MKIIKISDLRQNLQEVVDSIYYTNTPVVVMRRNKPRVIITPLPEGDKKIALAIKKYEQTAKELTKEEKKES